MKAVRLTSAIAAVAAVVYCWGCGEDSSTRVLPQSAELPSSPQPPGAAAGLVCTPTPPALYGITVKVLAYPGNVKRLGAEPLVWNVDRYCERVGFGNWRFCPTRPEGDPQKAACDGLATGRAADTGLWGPTWTWDDQPCDSTWSGCGHDPSDPFTVSVLDAGLFTACAASDVTVVPGGSRCGELAIHRTPPRTPNFGVDTGKKVLFWDEVPDASSYAVYLKMVPGDLGTQPPGACGHEWDQAIPVAKPPFSIAAWNKCHTSYFFSIAARNDAGESKLGGCGGYQPNLGCEP